MLGKMVFLQHLIVTVRRGKNNRPPLGNKPLDFSLHVLSVLADLIGNHELQKHLTFHGRPAWPFGTAEFFSFREDLFYLPV